MRSVLSEVLLSDMVPKQEGGCSLGQHCDCELLCINSERSGAGCGYEVVSRFFPLSC